MRKIFLTLLPLVLFVNCGAVAAQAVPDKASPDALRDEAKPGDPYSALEKDGTVKSSFPHGVVLRLNAIVTKSKTAIDQFDKERPTIVAAVNAAKARSKSPAAKKRAELALLKLNKLHSDAVAAKAELAIEGEMLLKTNQYYDNVIFSGMATFVSKVESELADEQKDMKALLTKK